MVECGADGVKGGSFEFLAFGELLLELLVAERLACGKKWYGLASSADECKSRVWIRRAVGVKKQDEASNHPDRCMIPLIDDDFTDCYLCVPPKKFPIVRGEALGGL